MMVIATNRRSVEVSCRPSAMIMRPSISTVKSIGAIGGGVSLTGTGGLVVRFRCKGVRGTERQALADHRRGVANVIRELGYQSRDLRYADSEKVGDWSFIRWAVIDRDTSGGTVALDR